MSAALGLSQPGKLKRFVDRRTALADRYDAALAPLAPVVRPVPRGPVRPALHLYQVLIDFGRLGQTRQVVRARILAAGASTQVRYIPLYRQPWFKARYGETRLLGAEAVYARALALPLFPAMTDADVEQSVKALKAGLA